NSYMPKFNVAAGYSNNSYEVTGYPENALSVQGSVNYILYDGGKKGNTYDSYESSIKSGSESLEDLKNQIAIQVTNYYYNYLSFVAQREVKLQEIEQLDAQYSRLKKFLDAGSVTDDEVQKIISNIQTAKVALHEIELNIETINHNLEYVIGQSVNIESGSTISEFASNENKLRADLKAIEYQLESLKATARATDNKMDKISAVKILIAKIPNPCVIASFMPSTGEWRSSAPITLPPDWIGVPTVKVVVFNRGLKPSLKVVFP
ncbi:MAG: TolC family protein, partial [Sphingobacteriia bacterium]|nr:TolC family protein [Sphingobacteriia bacterium]